VLWTLDVGPMFHDLDVHMINYKQMRDENMMHLVMISAQKKISLMNLTLLILMQKKVRYIS
jgi:hypothetical protein